MSNERQLARGSVAGSALAGLTSTTNESRQTLKENYPTPSKSKEMANTSTGADVSNAPKPTQPESNQGVNVSEDKPQYEVLVDNSKSFN